MHEKILKDYFTGAADAKALQNELMVSSEGVSEASELRTKAFEDFEDLFIVSDAHLVKVCDDVLSGAMPPVMCEKIGFSLMGSDDFLFEEDDEICCEVAQAWAAPHENYNINLETVQKFRDKLDTGEDTFTEEDRHPESLVLQ